MLYLYTSRNRWSGRGGKCRIAGGSFYQGPELARLSPRPHNIVSKWPRLIWSQLSNFDTKIFSFVLSGGTKRRSLDPATSQPPLLDSLFMGNMMGLWIKWATEHVPMFTNNDTIHYMLLYQPSKSINILQNKNSDQWSCPARASEMIVGIRGAKVAVAAMVEAGDIRGKTRKKWGTELATYRMVYPQYSTCSEFRLRLGSSQLWSRKCDSGRGWAGARLAVAGWGAATRYKVTPNILSTSPALGHGHCHLSATLQLIRDWDFSNTMIISSVISYGTVTETQLPWTKHQRQKMATGQTNELN